MRVKHLQVIKLSMLLSAYVLLSGCSPVHVAPIEQFQLTSLATTVLAKEPTPNVLLVEQVQANNIYQQPDMYYVRKPFQVETFARNAWAAPPADMLASLLVGSLQNSHYFKGVVLAPFVGQAHFRLKTQLIELKQNFLKKPSEVVLTVSAVLVNEKNSHVIASARFQQRVPASVDTPYGGVLAANKAVNNILEQLVEFVVLACKRNTSMDSH